MLHRVSVVAVRVAFDDDEALCTARLRPAVVDWLDVVPHAGFAIDPPVAVTVPELVHDDLLGLWPAAV